MTIMWSGGGGAMTAAATMTAGMYFYAYFCLNVDVFFYFCCCCCCYIMHLAGRRMCVVDSDGWLVGVCMEGCLSGWLFFLASSSILFAIFFLNTSFLKTSEKNKTTISKNQFIHFTCQAGTQREVVVVFFSEIWMQISRPES